MSEFPAPGIFRKLKLNVHAQAEILDVDFLNLSWPMATFPVLIDKKKIHSTLPYTVHYTVLYHRKQFRALSVPLVQ